MTSLLEKLGFEADARVAIVHVDDIGMCHAANVGAFQALREGPATCGSVMVPCPWFREAVALAREQPDVDLGVHLTLNAEWEHYRWGPVAGRRAVPSLLDADGYLPRTVAEVAEGARPEEVEIELRAQIEHALAAGLDVTHLDSHMGTLFLPQFHGVYARLGRDYRLPLFASRVDAASAERARLGGLTEVLRRAATQFEAEGFPILDGFDADSLGFAEGAGRAHNLARISALPHGVSYLICHASHDGEELRRITPDSAHQRDFERRFYGGREGAEALAREGVTAIGMRPLRELYRKRAAA